MLFQRLKVLWLGFWSNLIGGSESRNATLVAQGALQAHKGNVKAVRDALTNLIFQKKKIADQLGGLDREIVELRADVRQAAAENRDELAVNLIARLEAAQEEHQFLKTQLQAVEQDVETARDTERQLIKEIQEAERMLGTLASRHQALKVRRQLQQDVNAATRSLAGAAESRLHQPLADQIRRMEAELETMQTRRAGWEAEWQQMRETRSKSRHHTMLEQIKRNLAKNSLPAVVAEPAR